MIKKKIIKYVFFIFILSTNIVSAELIKISSEELKVDRNNGKSIFTGNVHAKDNSMELWSEKLTVFYDQKLDNITSIIAIKNVKILRIDFEAYGEKAIYDSKNNELIIEGNVVVIQNENQIVGDKLTMDLENSTSIMTSNSKNRVNAQIIN
tara:strand:- start:953 stop:1405 length:453 start_codon:yes stop_codon:yes gene_type:complete